ncbi:MAG TPA: RagB/SusD family nutrient uptake outer membrane protein, partial [Chitinophaga sp.]
MYLPYKKQWAAVLMGAALLAGCTKSLDQSPQASATKDAVFSSEAGLKLYTTSFYDILPDINTPYKTDCNLSDYGATTSVPDFIRANVYNSRLENSWNWKDLRNVNYFIVNNNDPAVPQAIRDNYQGLARFFRAYFYFEKVKRYGDVPWIGHPLAVNDSALYAGRDSRVLVMDSVIADLDFAASHITAVDDASRSTITQTVVNGFKSRVCLFEGTYRKYRHDSLPGSKDLLQQAAAAAKAVMDAGTYSLNQGTLAYRNLFISAAPVSSEVMMANVASTTLGKMNDANWYFTSATYGSRFSFTRDFVNTYLNTDGTPFTSMPGHDTMTLAHETQHRDLRLGQTIRLA